MAFKSVALGPFPGGLNTRDQAGELGPDELGDAMNVTLDDRGALVKRLGMERRFVMPLGNIISNSGIEVDATGYTTNAGATIARVTSESHSGSASLRVITPGVASTEGMMYQQAVSGSTDYTFRLWVKAPVGEQLFVHRAEYTGAFAHIASTNGPFFAGTGDWQEIVWPYTTDPTAAYVNIFLITSVITATTFYTDDWSLVSGLVKNTFGWNSRGWLITQVGAGMHKDGAAAFHTWSTSDRIGMCEYLGNLVMIHPVDGVRMYDGTTVTGPFANFPLGNTCAPWQNKCWFGGNPTNPARVSYTDIGAMTMGVNNFNELREKDASKITMLTGSSGLDVSGRPGLLAFKGDSAYRIYDSSNGAYNTIDASIGCGSNIGAVSAYGRTYVVNERGIFWTNGVDPMVEASGKIESLFHEDAINQTRADLYCAGRFQDRLYFSLPTVGQTANDLVIELNPTLGWVMAHSNAASCYGTIGRGVTNLVIGSSSIHGMLYNSHKSGSDDGAAIDSRVQSAWINPAFGNKVNIRRARFIGGGVFDAALLKDFESGASLPSMHVDIRPDDPEYDETTSEYDTDDYYGPGKFQDHRDFYSVGKVREFALRIEESGTDVRTGQPILGVSEPEIGAWSLSRMLLWVIDLGMR